jgi:ribosomal protein S6
MKSLSSSYEAILLFKPNYSPEQLYLIAFYYAKRLKSFGANNIHIRYRGKRRLTYAISDNTIGDYIQIRFSIVPKNLNAYLELIKLDEKLLRSFLLRLHSNNIE